MKGRELGYRLQVGEHTIVDDDRTRAVAAVDHTGGDRVGWRSGECGLDGARRGDIVLDVADLRGGRSGVERENPHSAGPAPAGDLGRVLTVLACPRAGVGACVDHLLAKDGGILSERRNA